MCTISFIARKNGYALAMNRDEKRARAAGLPPQFQKIDGRTVLCPSEPGGGTWIALNDHNITFALINWYAIENQNVVSPISRGQVVKAVSATASLDGASAMLGELRLDRIKPFRLAAIFPRATEVVEWSWDLTHLARKSLPWKTQQWISSGFDEPSAQRMRGATFEQACRQHSFGSLAWLRRLHASHSPQAGPFSICMHRSDAATVSYTEVIVSPRRAGMRYHGGAPCAAVDYDDTKKHRAWKFVCFETEKVHNFGGHSTPSNSFGSCFGSAG